MISAIVSLITSLLTAVVALLPAAAIYVLNALPLYRIAKRRGVSAPWLAWIPVVNDFVLGAVADDYQRAMRGKKTGYRKLLLVFRIINWVWASIGSVGTTIYLTALMGTASVVDLEDLVTLLLSAIVAMLLLYVLWFVVLLVIRVLYKVFRYIAFNSLYASCDPAHKNLYLVLTILGEVIFSLPARVVCLMICMNKDEGMISKLSAPEQE